jgi:dCMP deaminase
MSERSTCLRLKTAALIVKKDNIIAVGYNGAPAKSVHCNDFWYEEYTKKYQQYGTWEGFLTSDLFYKIHHEFSTINELHGEQNAILNAASNGNSCHGTTIYTLYAPCINCAKMIVGAKIRRCVYGQEYDRESLGLVFLKKNNVECVKIIP